MKTKIAIALLLACVACGGKDKPKPTTPDTTPSTNTAKPETKPNVKADQAVSPGLAVSPDIAAMCGIKATATTTTNPTFDYDKDDLTPEDRAVLDQLATCLMTGALKGKTVSLIGRADPRGTEEYNLGLGSRRAQAVNVYLTRLGVAQAQLAVTTRGAIDATGTDETGWKKDRRVDVQLASNP